MSGCTLSSSSRFLSLYSALFVLLRNTLPLVLCTCMLVSTVAHAQENRRTLVLALGGQNDTGADASDLMTTGYEALEDAGVFLEGEVIQHEESVGDDFTAASDRLKSYLNGLASDNRLPTHIFIFAHSHGSYLMANVLLDEDYHDLLEDTSINEVAFDRQSLPSELDTVRDGINLGIDLLASLPFVSFGAGLLGVPKTDSSHTWANGDLIMETFANEENVSLIEKEIDPGHALDQDEDGQIDDPVRLAMRVWARLIYYAFFGPGSESSDTTVDPEKENPEAEKPADEPTPEEPEADDDDEEGELDEKLPEECALPDEESLPDDEKGSIGAIITDSIVGDEFQFFGVEL